MTDQPTADEPSAPGAPLDGPTADRPASSQVDELVGRARRRLPAG